MFLFCFHGGLSLPPPLAGILHLGAKKTSVCYPIAPPAYPQGVGDNFRVKSPQSFPQPDVLRIRLYLYRYEDVD